MIEILRDNNRNSIHSHQHQVVLLLLPLPSTKMHKDSAREPNNKKSMRHTMHTIDQSNKTSKMIRTTKLTLTTNNFKREILIKGILLNSTHLIFQIIIRILLLINIISNMA